MRSHSYSYIKINVLIKRKERKKKLITKLGEGGIV